MRKAHALARENRSGGGATSGIGEAIAHAFACEGAQVGKIINITTVLAHKGVSGGTLYGASKAALTLLTKAWAAEFGTIGMSYLYPVRELDKANDPLWASPAVLA